MVQMHLHTVGGPAGCREIKAWGQDGVRASVSPLLPQILPGFILTKLLDPSGAIFSFYPTCPRELQRMSSGAARVEGF